MPNSDTAATLVLNRPMPPMLGNALCLDFINTLNPRTGSPVDFLHSYADLLVWAHNENILPKSQASALHEYAGEHRSEVREVFVRAVEFREAIYRIFFALAHGQKPSQPDLASLRDHYADAVSHASIEADGFRWGWQPNELRQILWPVAESAIRILLQGERDRLKECANHATCGWLFYDTTKNNSRRWCAMRDCGNQEKVRVQRQRRRRAKRAPRA
jgi:predicted RNA-binding Zn ribbon-like protein